VATGRRRRRLNMGVALSREMDGDRHSGREECGIRSIVRHLRRFCFRSHKVLDDVQHPGEFFVLVRENLVIKIGMYPFDNFGIVYIGTLDDARTEPGHRLVKARYRQSATDRRR